MQQSLLQRRKWEYNVCLFLPITMKMTMAEIIDSEQKDNTQTEEIRLLVKKSTKNNLFRYLSLRSYRCINSSLVCAESCFQFLFRDVSSRIIPPQRFH